MTQRYWWLHFIDFQNFFTLHVFKVKESIADIPTGLPCLSDLENPSQLPVREVLIILSYKFSKFYTIHVFEVRVFIANITTELPCLGDLESPGRLLFTSTGTQRYRWLCFVVFFIFPLFIFLRSRNPLLTLLLTYNVWETSKIFRSTSGLRGFWRYPNTR